MAEFHFLRPEWWLAWPLLWWLSRRWQPRAAGRNPWRAQLSDALYRHQLGDAPASRSGGKARAWLVPIGLTLAIAALAGPVWDKRELPGFRTQQARVFVMDLSRSMLLTDLQPSRLVRAKHKLRDLLQASDDRAVGLVVFGPVPYTVAPLTDDVNTVQALLPALDTDLLPVQGARIGPALEMAQALIQGAGYVRSEVLLITDSPVQGSDFEVASALQSAGHQLNVLGVGQAPSLPWQNPSGREVTIRFDAAGLERLATLGGGRYVSLTVDDQDINALLRERALPGAADQDKRAAVVQWVERGPWLLLPLLLLGAGLFRRVQT